MSQKSEGFPQKKIAPPFIGEASLNREIITPVVGKASLIVQGTKISVLIPSLKKTTHSLLVIFKKPVYNSNTNDNEISVQDAHNLLTLEQINT